MRTTILLAVLSAVLLSCSSSDQPTDPVTKGFAVRGWVTPSVAGESTKDITISLGTRTAVTDLNGYYEFKNVDSGSYVVRPSLNDREFDPPFITIHVDTAAVDSLNFTMRGFHPHPLSMVEVSSGTFMMGNDESARLSVPASVPRHRVTLTKDILVSATEISQGQWMRVMTTNPSVIVHPDLPVTRMSYSSVAVFCNLMSQLHGYEPVYSGGGSSIVADHSKSGYRLLTEAEWEYAASAGDTTALYDVDDPISDYTDQDYADVIQQINAYAWTENNSGSGGNEEPHPVGTLEPNAWGLYDMIGNVSELVEDHYAKYLSDPQTDPLVWLSSTLRIVRGSNFGHLTLQNHSLRYRTWEKFDPVPFAVGFRIARNK